MQYCSGDKIQKNEMAGVCIACGGEMCTGFWWGNLRERDHLEEPSVDGSIILRWIFRKWDGRGGIDSIDLAQDRDRWRALVNAVMNLFPYNAGNFLTENRSASKEELCCMDFFFFFFFFFFFHWHYSPLWALACRTMSFHFFLCATNSLRLLNPST